MSPNTEPTPETGPTVLQEAPAKSPPKRHRELFRMLLLVLKDPERAYTVSEEIMSTAGENVVAQLGARLDAHSASTNARMDTLGARLDALTASTNARMDTLCARLDALSAGMEALNARIDATAESTNARLGRLENQQVRLMWGVLGLQAALMVAIITFLFRA